VPNPQGPAVWAEDPHEFVWLEVRKIFDTNVAFLAKSKSCTIRAFGCWV
jgi:hypothetical protein